MTFSNARKGACRVVSFVVAPLMMALAAQASGANASGADSIIVQSTTSTQNAGFYNHVVPHFTAETGIAVRVVAVGTGQALKNAQNCDGDLLIVHAREAEEDFVAAGYGAARHDLMYNDFIIVGPQHDPAGLRYAGDVREAMSRIERSQSRFASRGDESGTHKKERLLWATINRTPEALPGSWYLETVSMCSTKSERGFSSQPVRGDECRGRARNCTHTSGATT